VLKNMKNEDVELFQGKVSELLVRHRSILDSLSKFQESAARVNRAVAKTVTNCGCLSIYATKQSCPPEVALKDCQKYMDSHLKGDICEQCREALEEELGNHLFYLTALCNLLNQDLSEMFGKEYQRLSALGFFRLS
jgi:NTP pyrophosphatase (non-canonical NTP hydrolase)